MLCLMNTEPAHLLTDADVENVKPSDSNLKLYDEQGLYLLIKTTGGKLWRFKYEYHGVQRSVTLGTYPKLSLVDARAICAQHLSDIIQGVDPSLTRKEGKKKRKLDAV